jgi:hypothetical protein
MASQLPDLTDDDKVALAELLRDTIAADRFPLSPRVRRLRAILAKLAPPAPQLPRPSPGCGRGDAG